MHNKLYTWNKNILLAEQVIYWIEVCTCEQETFYTSNKKLYNRSRNCSKHQEIDLSKGGKTVLIKKVIVLNTRDNAPSKEKCSQKEKIYNKKKKLF